MTPRLLLLYTSRAAGFAAAASLLYAAGRLLYLRLRGGRWTRRETLRLLFTAYLAALIHITVIRTGPDWAALRQRTAYRQLLLTPFESAVRLYRQGLWYVCVEVIGNIAGFVPFGLLLPVCVRRFDRFSRILPAAAELSLFIELSQFLLATGVTDIDDLLFNTLGGVLGYFLLLLFRRVRGQAARR